jgi:hypothetical protein
MTDLLPKAQKASASFLKKRSKKLFPALRGYFFSVFNAVASISTIMPGSASELTTRNVCVGSGTPANAFCRQAFIAPRLRTSVV